MNPFTEELGDRRQEMREKREKDARHAQKIQAIDTVADTVKDESEKTRKVIRENKKVEVTNFPEIATPQNIRELIEAVKELEGTTVENRVDFTSLEAGLDVLATKLEQGFESIPVVEPVTRITVDNQVDSTPLLKELIKEVRAKEFDPEVKVNYTPPEVKVPEIKIPKIEAPSVEVIVEIDELKAEMRGLKEMMQDAVMYLKAIAARPIPVGSGSGLSTGGSSGGSTSSVYDTAVYDTGTYS